MKEIFAVGAIVWMGLSSPGIAWAQEETLHDVRESQPAWDAEFESLDSFESLDDGERAQLQESFPSGADHRGFRLTLIALLLTITAGVFVRFRPSRGLRTAFLLGSVAVLGFWSGGCPCPISSLQNLVLWLMNVEVKIHTVVWFSALIPITYLFGRVWCGWVCHLGALQEFIHKPNRLGFLQGERARKAMRILRYSLFAGLLIQLFVTRDNQFIHIDPFKVAFNLRSFYLSGWILLALLMVSSLYVYRPFCRSACPVGLILGWVARLPYASKLGISDDCRTCKLCSKACPSQAVEITDRKRAHIHNGDCIACGSCMDACKIRDCISFHRKVEDDVRTIEEGVVDSRSFPIPVTKLDGGPRVRQRACGSPRAGERGLGPVVGNGADGTARVPWE